MTIHNKYEADHFKMNSNSSEYKFRSFLKKIQQNQDQQDFPEYGGYFYIYI